MPPRPAPARTEGAPTPVACETRCPSFCFHSSSFPRCSSLKNHTARTGTRKRDQKIRKRRSPWGRAAGGGVLEPVGNLQRDEGEEEEETRGRSYRAAASGRSRRKPPLAGGCCGPDLTMSAGECPHVPLGTLECSLCLFVCLYSCEELWRKGTCGL